MTKIIQLELRFTTATTLTATKTTNTTYLLLTAQEYETGFYRVNLIVVLGNLNKITALKLLKVA